MVIMAALRSRCGHYILQLWFNSSFFFFSFFSHILSGRRLDVYHTSTHDVASEDQEAVNTTSINAFKNKLDRLRYTRMGFFINQSAKR